MRRNNLHKNMLMRVKHNKFSVGHVVQQSQKRQTPILQFYSIFNVVTIVNRILIAHISLYRRYWRWCSFFQASAPFSIENAKFWPVLAILSRAYALFGAPCTGLKSVAVPQK